jgi:hypothetical protein
MMTFDRIKLVLLSMVATFSLAGCQSMGLGSSAGVDPALTKDEPTFISNSGVQACLAGAGIGALACLLAGADNMGACMAIAAAAGCGAGAGANYVLDSRRSQYANNEQRMNAYIADVEADTATLQERLVTVRAVLNKNQRQLAQIQRDIKTRTGDRANMQRELSQMRANQQYLNEELQELNEKIALYRDAAMQESTAGVTSPVFLSQLSKLERERDELQRLIEQTYKALPSIQVSG